MGHSGYQNTVSAVKKHYYWPNMISDIRKLVSRCTVCQAKRGRYLPMPGVFPTFKGLGIWQFVSVDLLEVKKPNTKQVKYVMSCIDAFSKAPELIVLQSKHAHETARQFRDQVIYRYGSPLVVRTDGGGEFMGAFDRQLKVYNIHHITTGAYYHRSNGLVERLNEQIKNKLQALSNSDEYSEQWPELVQLIAFAVRVGKSRSTGFSPYEILYCRDVNIPGHCMPLDQDLYYEMCLEELGSRLEALIVRRKETERQVRQALREMDNEIQSTMEKREMQQITNLEFGQPIVTKNNIESKLAFNTEGVSYFVKYTDERKDNIVYYNPKSGAYLTANISNVKLISL